MHTRQRLHFDQLELEAGSVAPLGAVADIAFAGNHLNISTESLMLCTYDLILIDWVGGLRLAL